jgi:DNA polymerase-3 subunit epsilon
VVLDTETTGLEVSGGHRIIEIGCVELINRRLTGRHFHRYVNPLREVDAGAIEVHGITNEFLADKPEFRTVAADFLEFIEDAELVIHNAPFDLGFLDAELQRVFPGREPISDSCPVIDTLQLARRKHPGQRNNLDALCGRYGVDNSQRDLHGALLDAEILADVYLAMTGGQTDLGLAEDSEPEVMASVEPLLTSSRTGAARRLRIIPASVDELAAHEAFLDAIESGGAAALWRTQ